VSADWVARGTALGSGVVAIMSLGWNVIAWRRQGPLVKVLAACAGRGDQMKVSGRIANLGRFDAHIESATFRWLASAQGNTVPKRLSCDLPATHIQGMTLPLPLASQTGHEFTVIDLEGIDLGLAVALHDRRQVTLTFCSASGKQAKRTIKYVK
jgi:hypothetical protein